MATKKTTKSNSKSNGNGVVATQVFSLVKECGAVNKYAPVGECDLGGKSGPAFNNVWYLCHEALEHIGAHERIKITISKA